MGTMKDEGESITAGTISRPDFSLAVAARALAASTVCYLEPHSRGLTFSAYDAIVKDTLLPPFSDVVPVDRCGQDVSTHHLQHVVEGTDAVSGDSAEQALEEGDDETNKNGKNNVAELQRRFNGDYELYEKYDQAGKQKVRCLVAVVHGRVRKMNAGDYCEDVDGAESVKDLEYIPGSISMTFRGTDTLENVLADVKAIALPYDDPPFVPDNLARADTSLRDGLGKDMKGATVHHGFRLAWHGDELRKTVLQYACDKIEELHREICEAQHLGLAMASSNVNTSHVRRAVPIVDITGHSLGGSIAVLAAFDLANTLSCIDRSDQVHIRAYTMGCPRVGNVTFARLFNKFVPDCHNVINDNDIVPAIPHSPSSVQSRLPVFCSCNQTWYRRHGRAIILKENGDLIIDPSKRVKYRREAKVLRLKKAADSHKTSSYRGHIRAAIQIESHEAKQRGQTMKRSMISSWARQSSAERKKHGQHKQDGDWEALDSLLLRLEEVIVEARSDPTRSFHLLPGGT